MEKLLQFQGVCKQFPGVQALADVNIDLYPGEVHVIVGENGAGKSTLMKVLSGAYQSDGGQVIFMGKPIGKNSPKISAELGIRMIYQELSLVPQLSVAANIFLGHELKKGIFVDDGAQMERASEILKEIGVDIDPATKVESLGVGSRQMVEIAKALSQNTKVLVFDEPTSSLSDREIADLFAMILRLKAKGVGMFYISHRLEEISQIGDRVSVMRDGRHIETKKIAQVSMEGLIESIAGRKIENLYPHTKKSVGELLFESEKLSGDGFENVSISVHRGEIVGLFGLVGAGRSEFARACMGIDPQKSGSVMIKKTPLPPNKIGAAGKVGLCLLPEDRKSDGLALNLSIKENMEICSLQKISNHGLIDQKSEAQAVKNYMNQLAIASAGMDKSVGYLSGGTQQKVVLAKWLMSDCDMFIFDEPTRGIDVGAKSSIYSLMDQLAGKGCGVLMISSDMGELLGMSDRVYVMSGGSVVGQLSSEQATQKNVLTLAFSNV